MDQRGAVFTFVVWALLSTCAFYVVSAAPPPADLWPRGMYNQTELSLGLTDLRKRAGEVELRILSLGASIVWGQGSSTGNGFRKYLRDQLRASGWSVNMVGSLKGGTMKDNDVQATSGYIIDQVKAASKNSLLYLPNVVLINAGTNDCFGSVDIPNAGRRMRVLIEELLGSPGMDKTTVILSTLIPCGNAGADGNRKNPGGVNDQYRELVTQMRGEGRRIVLADMDPPAPHAGNGWMKLATDYADDTHPNDAGFKKMAYVWSLAILEGSSRHFLQAPNPVNLDGGNTGGTCDKIYGDEFWAGQTQVGSGEDDGIYYHSSQGMGTVLTVLSDWDRDQWFFARLFRRDRDDFVGWFQKVDGSVAYGCWRNTGGTPKYVKIADLSVADNCIPRGAHFIDINADGLDDFVCVGPDGTAYASINQGDGTDSRPPTFVYKGIWKRAEAGFDQSRVLLGDVDGDGRADYCVVEANGDIWCWRNGWVNDMPDFWQPLGKRFTGKNMGDLNGIRFEDINGDGRDDWLWVSDTGATTTWTNVRSCAAGREGDGLNIAWRQGFAAGKSSGPTHAGMGTPGVRDRIHFARVFGEPRAFGLLGRQDYVYLEHTTENGKHKFDMKVWKNTGGGSTKIRIDGVKYCNMMGHPDGRADYVWTWSFGRMTLFPNKGLGIKSGGLSYWDPPVEIFNPQTLIGRSLDRRDLHLTDWDGDGACDIVWTNPDRENRPSVFLNKFPQTGQWQWEWSEYPLSSSQVYCPQNRGLGFRDLAVQFADISGNGRGDYICLEKDGRSWGWIHNSDGSWEYIDQYKFAEGVDRANLAWADINGDGRDDMIRTDKFTGDGTVWYNKGREDVGGSRFRWEKHDNVIMGHVAGTCTYYGDFDGNGRADVQALTASWYNTANTYLNTCGPRDNSGDDPEGVHYPGLPTMPGTNPGNPTTPPTAWRMTVVIRTLSGQLNYTEEIEIPYMYHPPDALMSEICVSQETARAHRDGKSNFLFSPRVGCGWLQGKDDAGKWNAVVAQEALEAFTTWYFIMKTGDLLPSQKDKLKHMPIAIGAFFGGGDTAVPNDYTCDLLGIGCSPAVTCGKTRFTALDLVLQSFGNVAAYYYTIWEAIGSIESRIQSSCITISSTFAVHDTGLSALDVFKTIVEMLQLIPQLGGGGLWGRLLSKGALDGIKSGSDKATTLAETVGPAVNLWDTWGEEATSAFESKIELAQDLAEAAREFITGFKNGLSDKLKWLMLTNAEDQFAQWALMDLLRNGAFLTNPMTRDSMSVQDIANSYATAFNALLISLAWKQDEHAFPAVIVMDGPMSSNPENPSSHMNTDKLKTVRMEYRGKTFWLVHALQKWDSQSDFAWQLPGYDSLPLQNSAWGFSWQDVIKSSYDAWEKNNKVYPYPIDPLFQGFGTGGAEIRNEVPYQTGIKTPGIFQIPVCDVDTLERSINYLSRRRGKFCDEHPCCVHAPPQ